MGILSFLRSLFGRPLPERMRAALDPALLDETPQRPREDAFPAPPPARELPLDDPALYDDEGHHDPLDHDPSWHDDPGLDDAL